MTNLWLLGMHEGVPQGADDVRKTVEPIRVDSTDSEYQHAPDWNQLETDQSGELVGLSPRAVGSDTHDTEKSVPWWTGAASVNHNRVIDEQVASSGTAARREEAGMAGHGSMQYAIGIDPVIRDGGAFGNDYFTASDMGANELAGRYMTPADTDNWGSSLAQQTAEENSRRAFQSSQINSWFSSI